MLCFFGKCCWFSFGDIKKDKDLKALNHWLLANKISLNSAKTEIIFFRKNQTKLPNIIIKLNGIKLTNWHNFL